MYTSRGMYKFHSADRLFHKQLLILIIYDDYPALLSPSSQILKSWRFMREPTGKKRSRAGGKRTTNCLRNINQGGVGA